jgi:hypothetical protein
MLINKRSVAGSRAYRTLMNDFTKEPLPATLNLIPAPLGVNTRGSVVTAKMLRLRGYAIGHQ